MIHKDRVIVNADDFGMSAEVNETIAKCFERRWISSATLITNMNGFEDAIHKISTSDFIRGKIGIHINLTEGRCLSDPIRKQKRFCDQSGDFIYNRKKSLFILTSEEKKSLYLEIKAQINRALKYNIAPTHIDSHHHVHTEWSISGIVTAVLKEYSINRIRICRNMGVDNGFSKSLYKGLLNIILKKKGFKLTDFFGDIDDFNLSLEKSSYTNKLAEIMVHPRPSEKEEIADLDEKNLGEKIKPILEKFRIIGYSDL